MMKCLLVFFGVLASLYQTNGEVEVGAKWISKPFNAKRVCAKHSSWTILPYPKDCNKFYVCVNHDAEEFSCAANSYFDKIELRCKPGACPYEDNFSSKKCQSHQVQRVPDDCSAFTACLNGEPEHNRCPEGQYFNVNYGSCQPISNSTQHKCSCILPEYTVTPNVDNCETYYVCIGGKAVLQQCPHGQYYNAQVSSCLVDLQGICLMAPTMSPHETEMLAKCEQQKDQIFHAAADDCTKFFMCLNGRVFAKQCPEGFYYDAKTHVCRVDHLMKCHMKMQLKQKIKNQQADNKPKVEMEKQQLGPPVEIEVKKPPTINRRKKNKKEPAKKGKEMDVAAQMYKEEIVKENELVIEKLEEVVAETMKEVVSEQLEQENSEALAENKVTIDINKEMEDGVVVSAAAENQQQATPEKQPTQSVYDKLSSKFINF